MINLAGDGYTHQEVCDALHGRTTARRVSFRFDLLDSSERFVKALNTVLSGSISMTAGSKIKKSAKFRLEEDPDIDYMSHRIQPFFRLGMPNTGFREWPLGIYLLNSPSRQDSNAKIYRDIDAYDGLQVLIGDKYEDRHYIAAGTNYVTAVKAILTAAGITKINIEATAKTLPADIEFDPEMNKLDIVNYLLKAINYIDLYVDALGYHTSRAYVSPSAAALTYTYQDDALSVIRNGLKETVDTFDIPNKFIRYVSNPDAATLQSTYTNTDPTSPLSTVSRGFTIVDKQRVDDIADQSSLDALVLRVAEEAHQVYGDIEFETAMMPIHEVQDVLEIIYSPLNIASRFVETSWTMSLKAGSMMRHKCQRVVSL